MRGKIDLEKNTITFIINDLSETVRCFVAEEDEAGQDGKKVHLGRLFSRITACGKPIGDIIGSREVTVDCPECVAEIIYRMQHPETKDKDFGVVTHK